MRNSLQRLLRSIAQRVIGLGVSIPALALSRLNEYIHLRKVFRQKAINCLLDVGAHQGQFAAQMRRLGYQGVIHSFEPEPSAYEILRKRSAGDPLWQCHSIALGETKRKTKLRINRRHQQMTSLLNIDENYGSVDELEVKVVPLDLIYDELTMNLDRPSTFLKTDAEGYDLKIFRGAEESLKSVRALLVEAFVRPVYTRAPGYLEVLAELEKSGFKLEHLAAVSNTFEDKLMCVNALMARANEPSQIN